jgi:hypothetical protein
MEKCDRISPSTLGLVCNLPGYEYTLNPQTTTGAISQRAPQRMYEAESWLGINEEGTCSVEQG